jgi:hypothetical protein
MRAIRTLAIAAGLAASFAAQGSQVPAPLQARLKHKNWEDRLAAAQEVGKLSSDEVAPREIATSLASVLNDPEIQVRWSAAKDLGRPLDADVAVPALLQALNLAEKDFAFVQQLLDKIAEARRNEDNSVSREDASRCTNAILFSDAVIRSLGAHRDERALKGLVEKARQWKPDRIPGTALQTLCEVLCAHGTFPALEAAIEIQSRSDAAIKARTGKPRGFPSTLAGLWMNAMRPVDTKHLAKMTAFLDAAIAAGGIAKPAGFDPGHGPAWKSLLTANRARFPQTLAAAAANSRRSDAASRPAASQPTPPR